LGTRVTPWLGRGGSTTSGPASTLGPDSLAETAACSTCMGTVSARSRSPRHLSRRLLLRCHSQRRRSVPLPASRTTGKTPHLYSIRASGSATPAALMSSSTRRMATAGAGPTRSAPSRATPTRPVSRSSTPSQRRAGQHGEDVLCGRRGAWDLRPGRHAGGQQRGVRTSCPPRSAPTHGSGKAW
jgi:hypothetical protein